MQASLFLDYSCLVKGSISPLRLSNAPKSNTIYWQQNWVNCTPQEKHTCQVRKRYSCCILSLCHMLSLHPLSHTLIPRYFLPSVFPFRGIMCLILLSGHWWLCNSHSLRNYFGFTWLYVAKLFYWIKLSSQLPLTCRDHVKCNGQIRYQSAFHRLQKLTVCINVLTKPTLFRNVQYLLHVVALWFQFFSGFSLTLTLTLNLALGTV